GYRLRRDAARHGQQRSPCRHARTGGNGQKSASYRHRTSCIVVIPRRYRNATTEVTVVAPYEQKGGDPSTAAPFYLFTFYLLPSALFDCLPPRPQRLLRLDEVFHVPFQLELVVARLRRRRWRRRF